MNLLLQRKEDDGRATIGQMLIDGAHECFILEDRGRDGAKVPGETRIPAGKYRLELKDPTTSKFDSSARRMLGAEHLGMIRLVGVPNFSEILIHWGNYHGDTEGCPLTGASVGKDAKGNNAVFGSRLAYKAFYRKVAPVLRCRVLHLEIRDEPFQNVPHEGIV